MTWERAQLFRNLAVMIESGVPLPRAVETLQGQWAGQPLGEALAGFQLQLARGCSLSQAGASVGQPFQRLHIALLRLGEESGALPEALEVLAEYEEEQCKLGQQVRSQLAYPLLVLACLLVMMAVGLPWLAHSLPGSYSWTPCWLLLGALLAVARLRQPALHWLQARPPFSSLRRAWATSQFLGLWSRLLERGVPLATSLELAGDASACDECQQACLDVRAQLIAGHSLAGAFQRSSYFGPDVKGCVVSGTESGGLAEMLLALQNLEKQKLQATIEASVRLLTPTITVLLGLLLLIFLHQTLTPLLALVNSL
ncbi:MAG: type II secretion system F family protein [Vulcanimicrobiota bacterium]